MIIMANNNVNNDIVNNKTSNSNDNNNNTASSIWRFDYSFTNYTFRKHIELVLANT